MKFSPFVSLALSLVLAGCGATGTGDNVETTTSEPAIPTSPDASTTEAAEAPEGEDPTDYLVAITNGAADLAEKLRSHEDEVSEKYAEFSTEDDQLAYLEAYYGGESSIYIEYAHRLRDITPPGAFSIAHTRYVETILNLYESRLAKTERLDSIDAWSDWSDSQLAVSDALLDFVDACGEMEETAEREGFVLELSCPAPPPEVVNVRVEVGAAWQADPDLAPPDGVVLELEITNVGETPLLIVVLDVFDGDPLNLPIENGLVDLTLSGVTFDSNRSYAYFGVAYPDVFSGEDSQLGVPPPEVRPGETVFATVHGSGSIVVFDYTAGQFEAGARVVIERGGEKN